MKAFIAALAMIALAGVVLAGCSNGDNPIRDYKEWRAETFGPPNPYGGVHLQHGMSAGRNGHGNWLENRGGRVSICNNYGGSVNCR